MMPEKKDDTFRARAAGKQPSAVGQFSRFIFQNKKWWLAPIVILLVLLGMLILLSGSGVAPFIYSLF